MMFQSKKISIPYCLFLSCLVVGCDSIIPNNFLSHRNGNQAEQKVNIKSEKESLAETSLPEIQVDEPVMVAGSFLYCEELDGDKVGCRLGDFSGKGFLPENFLPKFDQIDDAYKRVNIIGTPAPIESPWHWILKLKKSQDRLLLMSYNELYASDTEEIREVATFKDRQGLFSMYSLYDGSYFSSRILFLESRIVEVPQVLTSFYGDTAGMIFDLSFNDISCQWQPASDQGPLGGDVPPPPPKNPNGNNTVTWSFSKCDGLTNRPEFLETFSIEAKILGQSSEAAKPKDRFVMKYNIVFADDSE